MVGAVAVQVVRGGGGGGGGGLLRRRHALAQAAQETSAAGGGLADAQVEQQDAAIEKGVCELR